MVFERLRESVPVRVTKDVSTPLTPGFVSSKKGSGVSLIESSQSGFSTQRTGPGRGRGGLVEENKVYSRLRRRKSSVRIRGK